MAPLVEPGVACACIDAQRDRLGAWRSDPAGCLASSRSSSGCRSGQRLGQARQRRVAVHVDDRHRVVGGVRLVPGQHLEQHDAEAVEVTARIRAPGRDPAPGSCSAACRRSCPVSVISYSSASCLARPKSISASCPSTRSMTLPGLRSRCRMPARMQRAQRARDLRGEAQRLGGRDATAHAPAQIAALEVLHRQIGVIVGDAELVQPHDIRDDARAARSRIPAESARTPGRRRSRRAARASPSAPPVCRPSRSRPRTAATPSRARAGARADIPGCAPRRSGATPGLRPKCASRPARADARAPRSRAAR